MNYIFDGLNVRTYIKVGLTSVKKTSKWGTQIKYDKGKGQKRGERMAAESSEIALRAICSSKNSEMCILKYVPYRSADMMKRNIDDVNWVIDVETK